MDQPNPIAVFWSITANLMLVEAPGPFGDEELEHVQFDQILDSVAGQLNPELADHTRDLSEYIKSMTHVDPDRLTRDHALAYWINLYNAGALRLAAMAQRHSLESVLRVPGAFSSDFATIDGQELSLDAIEHAKIRRFGDPRIHAALVCGSVSCPTLRPEAFRGHDIDKQLDDQMRRFLSGGGAVSEGGVLRLSRVFKWYGSDFARPYRMPTFLPSPRRRVLAGIDRWLDIDVSEFESIEYQPYDWGLRCAVGP